MRSILHVNPISLLHLAALHINNHECRISIRSMLDWAVALKCPSYFSAVSSFRFLKRKGEEVGGEGERGARERIRATHSDVKAKRML